MSWLSGFSNRLKLTIDHTNVDSTLSDFPVLIKISDSSGISSTDVSAVFTELGSDANRKKIAVTTDDEETQCYVEIERFDYANSVAWLWIKVPSVASGAETILYLYYDSSQDDNTTYVGDTTDTPAQNVWDSDFKLIMHMSQDPNGDVADVVKDSTSNVIHATPVGSMTTADLVDGKIGKAIDFDESNDYLKTASADDALNITTILTLEAIIKPSYTLDSGLSIGKGICGRAFVPNLNQDSYFFLINTDGKLQFGTYGGNIQSTKVSWLSNTAFYVAGTYNSVGLIGDLFVNNSKETLTADSYDSMAGATNSFVIGLYGPTNFFPGIIDEVRVSNVVRSDAWIKATYYSNWDELVSFEIEVPIDFTFSNPVPTHLSTTYGTTEQLQLTTTISGTEESYTYDADFYDGFGVQVGTTILGVSSGSPAASNSNLPTPSGVDYNWYVVATSSGSEGISSTYTFSNRFLYEGYITENDDPVNRAVRLYYRDTGELIDSTTSSGDGGYYSLDALVNDEHFIVAFDDEAGEDYNALILDRLLPNGEE